MPSARKPSNRAEARVSTPLVPAILATICCCLPAGIVAIVYAAQVNSKLAAGDYVGARRSSHRAKVWCWVALLLSIAYWVLSIGVYILMVEGYPGGSLFDFPGTLNFGG